MIGSLNTKSFKVGRSSEGLLDIEFYRLLCPTLTTPMPVVLVNFIYMWRHGSRQTTHKVLSTKLTSNIINDS